jgi:Na+-transporting methylmalonyl-CoA/oxaloacetate decarboxylase gamma subunit
MFFKEGLTTARVLAVFAEEVRARRGEITETFDDGKRLFSRAVLLHVAEVGPDDQIRSGVAIKATGDGVWLCPYTFRRICSNGAIAARTLEERPIADPHLQPPELVLEAVRATVEACSKAEVFTTAVGEMRRGREATAIDLLLLMLPLLSCPGELVSELIERSVREKKAPETNTPRATAVEVVESEAILSALIPALFRHSAQPGRPATHHGDLMTGVLSQYRKEGDPSRFGLAQAITAVARDVQDPDLKWDLEKLGGAVALGTLRGTRDECEGALAALLKCDLEKLDGAGARGTCRRKIEESGVALASLAQEQLLRTA